MNNKEIVTMATNQKTTNNPKKMQWSKKIWCRHCDMITDHHCIKNPQNIDCVGYKCRICNYSNTPES